MKVRFRERALADLEEIYRYLEPRSPTGARNVLRAIHNAVERDAQFPESPSALPIRACGRKRLDAIAIGFSIQSCLTRLKFSTYDIRLAGLGMSAAYSSHDRSDMRGHIR